MADIVNVQNAPGVPPVLFAPGFQGPAGTLSSDSPGLFQGIMVPQWGLYSGGSPIISADTIVSFEYKKDYIMSDYPVEEGGFDSFDKVEIPYDVRVKYTSGGSESNRAALLASIAAIVGDLNFYQVVTPEAVYVNANVKHYDYTRTAINGLGLLTVEVWCEEVRVASGAGTGLTNTVSPTAASQTNGGTVQPTNPNQSQSALSSLFN
jgi:hypothetical protein